jgi:hypothetical protein
MVLRIAFQELVILVYPTGIIGLSNAKCPFAVLLTRKADENAEKRDA